MKITVNGETVGDEVFQREVQQVRQQNPDEQDEAVRERAKQNIVEWTLIRQQAREEVESVPAKEIDAEFDKLVERHGGRDQFFQRFNLTGSDESRVKSDLEQNLKVQKFLEQLSADVAQPDEDQIRSYYEEHKDRFTAPPEVHAAHIVCQPDRANPEKTFNEMLDVRRQLREGADFASMADTHSSCEDAGGDLGYFARGKMVPEFETVVFSMEAGEISPIFQTQFGWHIATVHDRKAPRQMEFDEVRDRITESLLHDRKNDAIGEWVDARKGEADIRVEEDEKPED
ncbi:peptidylprolyl isomerase [Kiritimatiella glycovorans]|uniref:Foldase protein PrsA 1 n=1 Tax=Kiritimatiella glycovorans TaxID=1307763 RepID=A0A0G3EB95_9BACT|nr:peptidylprolyl isomerase [Kiritimatiella glycovorans]AKJ63563.1 Foldase protein PrsA 1 precursor [Kiritimatiella glycovorans]